MHIKFLNHGKGKTSKATDYIMAEKDHTGKVRETPAVVLRGNPEQTGTLGDSLEFEHKYRSAVFAFHPDDKPTDEQLDEFLNKAEQLCFAGLDKEQFDYTAVYHNEPIPHIHGIYPRVELTTGKSFNVAPPGWQKDFDALRDYFNEKYGWISPDTEQNKDIERITQAGNDLPNRGDFLGNRAGIKAFSEALILNEIEAGNIENREDIILSLQSEGFEIPRKGKDYITIFDKESDTKVRLKGVLYNESWTIEQTLERANGDEKQGNGTVDSKRVESLERELEERISGRAEYNQKRYSSPSPSLESGTVRDAKREPEKRSIFKKYADEKLDKNNNNNDVSLPRYLYWELGADAILSESDSNSINNDRKKQKNSGDTEKSIREPELKQMWEESGDLRADRPRESRISGWIQDFKNKIGEKYDGIRDSIKQRFRDIISSIRGGYAKAQSSDNRANRAGDDLNKACDDLKQSIQRSGGDIKRGVQRVRANRVDELTKFKTDINLVEYAASQGYILNKKKSTKNSKVMKSVDGDKIIIATDNDTHGIYFSVSRGDSGSIIDFVQARQGLNLGEVRKELRNFGGFSDVPEYENYK